MSTGICEIDRIVIAIAIQVQAVYGFGVEVGCIIGRDETAPFGGVIPGVAIIQAGIVIEVIPSVTDGVSVGDGIVGRLAGNGAVAPGIIQVLRHECTGSVENSGYIALQVSLEEVAVCCAVGSIVDANDGILVIQIYDVFNRSRSVIIRFVDCFRNQTACVVVIIFLAVVNDLAGLHRIQTVGAFQEGISLGNPLAETVIAVGVVRGATSQGAAGQPGQLTLAPCGGHTVIAGGTAHGVVGNAATAEAGQLVRTVTKGSGHKSTDGLICILPLSPSTVKKKPPRP